MVVATRSRETMLACLGLLGGLMATGTACSPEPLSAATAIDFSGEWILSDSVSGLENQALPPRICKTWDRPMHISLYIGDNVYGAQEQFGGTVSCVSDGAFGEPTPIQGSGRSFFLEVGADSTILYPQPTMYQDVSIRYKATTISPDRLAGTVYLPILGRPDDGAAHGIWEMIRSR